MKPFDIFIAHISWGSGGKSRPVLVIMIYVDTILVFPITTQYENKSKTIQAQYFKINEWSLAGLKKPSYIDTGTLLELPISVIDKKQAIGELTISDKKRLLEFLNR